MDQHLLEIFFNNVYIKSDAQRKLALLRQYLLACLFSGSRDSTKFDPDQIRWLNKLGADFYQGINQQNVYDLLHQIEETINQNEPLIIELPFQMPDSELPVLGNRIRELVNNPKYLIEVKYNPDLVAGPALIWKGVYRDFSIRQRIAEHRAEILNNLKEYIH